MKPLILFAIFLIAQMTFQNIYSQSKTYLGIEYARANDLMTFYDEGKSIKPAPLYTSFYGILLSREIGENLSLSTGVQDKHYWTGFKFQNETYDFSSSVATYEYSAIQIPVTLTGTYSIFKNKLFLQTTLGYHFCIRKQDKSESIGTSKFLTVTDSIITNSFSSAGLKKTFSLIETGIGFTYKLKNYSKVYISGSYFNGFSKLSELEIFYAKNNEQEKQAKGISTGDYFAIKVGYLYPLNSKNK